MATTPSVELLQAAAAVNLMSLARDAARYHWLRDKKNEHFASEVVRCCSGTDLDAEIDKAMAEETAKPHGLMFFSKQVRL